MNEFRLLTRPEMESIPGIVDPIPGSMFAIGMVDEQGLAAACAVFFVVHGDPIWVREDLRKTGVARELWEATRREIEWRNMGPEVFFGMSPTTPGQPTEDRLAAAAIKAGGHELKARFFVVPVMEARG